MDRKNLIIVLAVVVIIVCLVVGFNKKDIENANLNNNNETNIELNYTEVTDEITGTTYYQIYNEKNGEVMHNVVDESAIKMYIDNPDFIGPENEEIINESGMKEYNEDESLKENI